MAGCAGRLAFAFAATTLAVAARADVPGTPPPDDQAFLAGPVKLWPLLTAGVELDDNVFQQSPSEEPSPSTTTITVFEPGFLAELPFSRSWARVGYTAARRDYGSAGIETDWSHHATANVRLAFGNGAVVEAGDDYRRGILDVRTFDPGGDVTFAGEKFRRNEFSLSVGHERGEERSFFVHLAHADRVTVGERLSGLYDSLDDRVAFSAQHALAPRLAWVWEASQTSTDLSKPEEDTVDERSVRDRRLRTGARGNAGAHASFSILAGAVDLRFEGNGVDGYTGLAVDGNFRHEVQGGPAVTVQAVRTPYPLLSSGTEDYYRSDQYSVRIESSPTSFLVAGGGVAYHANDYPQSISRRADQLLVIEAWGGYRLRNGIAWQVYVRTLRRGSSEPSADFDENRVGALLRIGG